MGPRELYRRWQERRRERVERDYGNLSDAERAEFERLREEHSPLGEMGRGSPPPPLRDERP